MEARCWKERKILAGLNKSHSVVKEVNKRQGENISRLLFAGQNSTNKKELKRVHASDKIVNLRQNSATIFR